jgi:hypothetical protein
MRTLSQILVDANAYLDLDASLPSGDDLSVRIAYAQEAVREWADSYRWKELTQKYNLFLTLGTASLPGNFKELVSIPEDTNRQQYPEILPGDTIYKNTTDRYSYIEGNEAMGFTMTVNSLASLATLAITFQRQPSNMATLSDICEVPDDRFVVKKVISLVLQSRSDERFPTIEADAQRLLTNMIGRTMVQTPGGDMRIRRVGSAAWAIGRTRG